MVLFKKYGTEWVMHNFYTAKEKQRGIHLFLEDQVHPLKQRYLKKCFHSNHSTLWNCSWFLTCKLKPVWFFCGSSLLSISSPLFSLLHAWWDGGFSILLSSSHLEWRGSLAKATLTTRWYSRGILYPVQKTKPYMHTMDRTLATKVEEYPCCLNVLKCEWF